MPFKLLDNNVQINYCDCRGGAPETLFYPI